MPPETEVRANISLAISHVAIFDGEYNVFLWPCVAVWCFDRSLRIGRLVSLNFPTLQATASYNRAANAIRVKVPVRKLLCPQPGTYFYVYLINGFKSWESHPFTLASWESKQLENRSKSHYELTFLIQPHSGFTARLREHIQQGPEAHDPTLTKSLRIAIEGPYGTPYNIQKYSSALLIIGGSGITVALSHLRALREGLLKSNQSPTSMTLHSVRLIWAVRNAALFHDVYQKELLDWCVPFSLATQVSFRMDVHLTGDHDITIDSQDIPNRTEPKSGDVSLHDNKDTCVIEPESPVPGMSPAFNEGSSKSPTQCAENVHIVKYRPAVHDLILNCAQEWDAKSDKMAVICCGPGSMVDDGREAVVTAVGMGYNEIEFHPEMFNW